MTQLAVAFDILARDKASREIDKVGNALDRTARKGHGFGRTIHAAMLGATSSIVGAAVASVKAAGDYQEALTSLVTGAGESQKNIKLVGDGMLSLAGKVGIGANDLAKGMYLIESSGKHGAEGLLVLKAAAEGARVGAADMATVADGLTTALNDYKIPAAQAAQVTSKLVATVAAGKTHMGDLAGALATVLPAASAAGVGLNQVLGAMATMTAAGTPAADAATYLKQTIAQLSNPTAKAAQEMEGLGLSSIDISKNLGKRGLTGTLDLLTTAISRHMGPAGTVLIEKLKKSAKSTTDFQKALADLSPPQQTYIAALAKMVGGTKSMQAALELTGSNAKTFNDNVRQIGATTTEAGGHVKGFALTQKDFNTQLANVTSEVKSLTIEVGDKLLPVLSGFLTGMQNGTGAGGTFAKTMKDLASAGKTAWQDVKPLFTFIGDHPKLFAEVAKDAAIFAVAMKGISTVKKLPGLGSLFGGGKGGLLGGAVSMAKPLPVFVTNPGFGGGGGGSIVRDAEKVGGGFLAGLMKVLGRKILPKALPGLSLGTSSVLLTSGDAGPQSNVQKSNQAFVVALNKLAGSKGQYDQARITLLKRAAGMTFDTSDSKNHNRVAVHDLVAEYDFLVKYGKKTAEVRATLRELAADPTVAVALKKRAQDVANNTRLISGDLLGLMDSAATHAKKTGDDIYTKLGGGLGRAKERADDLRTAIDQLHEPKINYSALAGLGGGMARAKENADNLRDSINGLPSAFKPPVDAAHSFLTQLAKIPAHKDIIFTASIKTSGKNVKIAGLHTDSSGIYVQGIGGKLLLADGGWVRGPGTSRSDSIPAMLSNREFVVNAKAAQKYGAQLEAMNAGSAPMSTVVNHHYNTTVNNNGQRELTAREIVYAQRTAVFLDGR